MWVGDFRCSTIITGVVVVLPLGAVAVVVDDRGGGPSDKVTVPGGSGPDGCCDGGCVNSCRLDVDTDLLAALMTLTLGDDGGVINGMVMSGGGGGPGPSGADWDDDCA